MSQRSSGGALIACLVGVRGALIAFLGVRGALIAFLGVRRCLDCISS